MERDRIADRKTQTIFSVAVLLCGLMLFINNLNATETTGVLLRTLGALFLMFGITALRAVQQTSSTGGGDNG